MTVFADAPVIAGRRSKNRADGMTYNPVKIKEEEETAVAATRHAAYKKSGITFPTQKEFYIHRTTIKG